jgi:hypothetical protein
MCTSSGAGKCSDDGLWHHQALACFRSCETFDRQTTATGRILFRHRRGPLFCGLLCMTRASLVLID